MNETRLDQAFINEYKGAIFEFLVCKQCALLLALNFEDKLDADYLHQLGHYEKAIREFDSSLLQSLLELSKEVANKIYAEIKFKVFNIELCARKKNTSEADFIFWGKDEFTFLEVSLKLCKKNSFINTKSAGVKSFLKKYFQLDKEQEGLNLKIQTYFESFARDIHANNDIIYSPNFTHWKKKKFPELPGGLDEKSSERLKILYHQIIREIYLSFVRNFDQLDFSPLAGFSSRDHLIVICFHQGTKAHLLDQVIVDSFQNHQWQILELNELLSSFEIKCQEKTLQIRIKPMNKFSTPSYKVNCSVKYHL